MKHATPGKQPASATPSRKRMMTKLVVPVISPAQAPQNNKMIMIQRRAPRRAIMTLAST